MKKNIFANFVGRFWSILSNFLFIPLYINILGFESYSVISFTLVIAGLMAFLDSGITATLSREFARNDNSREKKIKIFKTLETLYFGLIIFAILLVVLLSHTIASKWLNLKTIPPEQVVLFLKIISLDIGFQLLLRFYTGGWLGLEKQVKANAFLVGWGILRNGLVVIAILIKPSLLVFFTWQTGSTILFALLIGLMLRKELTGKLKFDFKFKIDRSVLKSIWRFAGGMLLISLVAGLNTQMDKMAITKMLPVECLGYYSLAVSLSMGIIVLVNPISTAVLPRFTTLFSEGKNRVASKLFSDINIIVTILVFSVMANMNFYAHDLIWIWTNKNDIASEVAPLLPTIAFAIAMLALQILPFNIAIANGYTRLNNVLGISSLIITLPGYWIATRQFGPIGAATVYCVVQTFITVIYTYVISRKFLSQYKWSMSFLNQFLMPLITSFGIAFIFSIIPNITNDNRIFSLLWIGLGTLVTFLGTLALLIRKNPIQIILSLFSTKNNQLQI
ncbi:oligosaccharide flippase family protein [Gaoshiqia sp. Z1-71]|uniref:oligosaccharide flippase family protein n=1 Tax=Gaoshiqia hydrogeniformans TaxID=3290090 RepID=UPI003BF8FDC9